MIHIGTSGFFYEHWNAVFYPKDVAQDQRLDYYSTFFSTVEINSTFYHLPKEETVKNWTRKVPQSFIFSIKASRFITHQKRLLDSQDTLPPFFEKIKLLKEKCGPILFQLPPSFQRDDKRLETFISHLPSHYRYVFEFRHPTWENDEVYNCLARRSIACCISDLAGHLTPLVATSSFIYLRLHGPKAAYRDSYTTAQLQKWKEHFETWTKGGKEVFCYFDNDEKGYAVKDALRLIKMMSI